jgi:hypothetical protein
MRGEATHVSHGAGTVELTTEPFDQATASDR